MYRYCQGDVIDKSTADLIKTVFFREFFAHLGKLCLIYIIYAHAVFTF